jgi:hypothetical protein
MNQKRFRAESNLIAAVAVRGGHSSIVIGQTGSADEDIGQVVLPSRVTGDV